jgi:cobalt-zinc-cadmium efflux system outer membrane protein
MIRRGAWTSRALAWGAVAACAAGCAAIQSPMPPGAHIRKPIAPPELPPPQPGPPTLPAPPAEAATPDAATVRPDGPLDLTDVLASVATHFPLLYAVEQERAIAAGRRLAAEGQFDTVVRAGGTHQAGTFAQGRVDVGVEQPLPWAGGSVFGGWRLGRGNFPVYYGDRKTGEGGEFRAGVALPLLRDAPVDPRRVALRQAQIAEQLADPAVRRARLDYFRDAAQAYWSWVGAGAQYRVAEELLELARNRQAIIDEQRRQQLVPETVEVLNRRLIANREEALLAVERGLQQAAFRLSLFLRDAAGNPVVPQAGQLPQRFIDVAPPPPDPAQLQADVLIALASRPELVWYRLQKEQVAADLRLALNQTYPALDLVAAASQDVGPAKPTFTGTGPFQTERTAAEVGLTFEVPVQRRDALGRARAARAVMAQLLAQERFARDEVTAQVQDAASELAQTYRRLDRARDELRQAVRVRELETEAFRGGRISLVELNIQEVAAAEAQTKVVEILAAYYRAVAEYLAALGADPFGRPPETHVLPRSGDPDLR